MISIQEVVVKIVRGLIFLCVLVSLAVAILHAQGARITLRLACGGELSGELLAVRDSALVLSILPDTVEGASPVEGKVLVQNRMITRIGVERGSREAETIETTSDYDFCKLKPLARYSSQEPKELTIIK